MSESDQTDDVMRHWGGVSLWDPREPAMKIMLREQRMPDPIQPELVERDYPGVRYVAPSVVDKRRAANRAARKARRNSR